VCSLTAPTGGFTLPEGDWLARTRAPSAAGVVSDAVLNAWIARAKRDEAGTIDAWRAAVLAEDALSYNEPPDWFSPTRESLGAALLRAKQFAQAEDVFRQDLTINPRSGRSLYGLWQTLLAQKKGSAAAAEKEFREAWKNADVQLDLETF
jgi:tetratricopeptide (TPR) repeat protein